MMAASPVKYLLTVGLILTQRPWLTHMLRNAMTSDPGEPNNLIYLKTHMHSINFMHGIY